VSYNHANGIIEIIIRHQYYAMKSKDWN